MVQSRGRELPLLNREESAMTTLARPGVPVGGFKTVGQIRATNELVFGQKQNAMGVAVELLTRLRRKPRL